MKEGDPIVVTMRGYVHDNESCPIPGYVKVMIPGHGTIRVPETWVRRVHD